ncbi:cytochrome c oxidase subunit I [Chelativorans sp. AA-79]|uniref:cytochrome c oxidase subunit I n=1 Tax=Chelativorans sp. AA-79 TaxID=3028735 RepID=UPI0023F8AFDD|nr:cytochrome c oxidase subunit I [Chelativorans sp. AA-79]WEX10904.1 cytochrome c oxidase subunit I [Chelativorans sp. AA-79]
MMEPETPDPIRLHKALSAVWDTGPGLARLAAVNHTMLGRRFMLTAAIFFAIGGLLAMLIRAQLASSDSPFIGEDLYAQVFTMHGTIMMFLFAIPMLEGLAIYLLPKLLGARDLAFPRLTAYGYWCYLFGGTMLVAALAFGLAPDSGWFMYTPLSSRAYSPGINADVWLLGVTFVEISALSAAVEIVASILKLRAPGMSLDRMPIFAWYMLVVGGMMLFGFPPLILGSILLEVERAFDFPFFDPTRGGDPLLWQHLFWLFGHPEVYIIFLPAAGAVSTFLPVFADRPLAGYRAVVVAVIAMGFLSFGLWVHHMYTVGIPHLALGFFSAASGLVAIPTAIQIFAWLATLAHGRPRFSIPMLYVFGFLFIFVLGGLTGVMVAMVPFDWQAHDTHFVVAHLHYVLVGGFVFPMLAAAYYWMPHLTGRVPVHHLSKAAFWLIFIGFNTTFLIMHLTGLRGMPRRVHTYPQEPGIELFNLISSVGGFLMTIGFGLVLLDVVLQFRFGRPFRRDPWRAGTLEWAMPTPPPSYAFASIPEIAVRADRLEPARLGPEIAAGRGYLGFVREGRMETLGVEPTTGRIEQVIELPRQSYVPLLTALATGAFFLAMMAKIYLLAIVALVLVVALFLLWTRGSGSKVDVGALPIGRGAAAPPHFESGTAPSTLAMLLTLAADATLYASLLFGGLFLWVSAPDWPTNHTPEPGLLLPVLAILTLALAVFSSTKAVRAAGGKNMPWLLATAASHAFAALLFGSLAFAAVPDRAEHAVSATVFAVYCYAGLHALLGVVFALYGAFRARGGYVSERRNLDLQIGGYMHAYSAAAGMIAILFGWLLTLLGGPGGME